MFGIVKLRLRSVFEVHTSNRDHKLSQTRLPILSLSTSFSFTCYGIGNNQNLPTRRFSLSTDRKVFFFLVVLFGTWKQPIRYLVLTTSTALPLGSWALLLQLLFHSVHGHCCFSCSSTRFMGIATSAALPLDSWAFSFMSSFPRFANVRDILKRLAPRDGKYCRNFVYPNSEKERTTRLFLIIFERAE